MVINFSHKQIFGFLQLYVISFSKCSDESTQNCQKITIIINLIPKHNFTINNNHLHLLPESIYQVTNEFHNCYLIIYLSCSSINNTQLSLMLISYFNNLHSDIKALECELTVFHIFSYVNEVLPLSILVLFTSCHF